MVDLCDKGSEPEEISSNTTKNPNGSSPSPSSSSSDNQFKRTCADCGTSKTPLWRGGPVGPKSLCNACGIRNRKRRRALLGLSSSSNNKNKTSDKKSKKNNSNSNSSSENSDNISKFDESLKRRLLKLGKEVLLRRSSVQKQRRKLGEVEQAAVLLMALSYGSVSA